MTQRTTPNDAPDVMAALQDSYAPVSTKWRCERCKASGIVNTLACQSGLTVIRRIRAAHSETSPECDPIVRTGE